MVQVAEGQSGDALNEGPEALLNAQQNRALMLLGEGKGIAEVAKAVGVHRGTVYRWISADSAFRAAYNAWQLEQRESCRALLTQCAKRAAERISSYVDVDANLGLKLIKVMGMLPGGETLLTEPAQVQRLIELEQLEAQAALEQRRGPGRGTASAKVEDRGDNVPAEGEGQTAGEPQVLDDLEAAYRRRAALSRGVGNE